MSINTNKTITALTDPNEANHGAVSQLDVSKVFDSIKKGKPTVAKCFGLLVVIVKYLATIHNDMVAINDRIDSLDTRTTKQENHGMERLSTEDFKTFLSDHIKCSCKISWKTLNAVQFAKNEKRYFIRIEKTYYKANEDRMRQLLKFLQDEARDAGFWAEMPRGKGYLRVSIAPRPVREY